MEINNDIILETRGLTKSFKGFTAVSDVDLKVKRGTIHALIGPNGAGKTTCFNLLTKFLIPTSGQILFNGIDITNEEPPQIARRGVIRSFQISAVFPHLTVLENVRVALQKQLGTSLIARVAQGRTILMVEHNMKVVSTIANTITVLQRGAVLAEGSYNEVSNNPQVMQAYMGTAEEHA